MYISFCVQDLSVTLCISENFIQTRRGNGFLIRFSLTVIRFRNFFGNSPSVVVYMEIARTFPNMAICFVRFFYSTNQTYPSHTSPFCPLAGSLPVSLILARENTEVYWCFKAKFVHLLEIRLLQQALQRKLYSWSPLKSWATLQRRKATQKMV